MFRFSCLLSVRHEFSVRARALIALLALVQIIAPTWHICELGGNSCCPPTGETTLHCALPSASEVLTTPQAEGEEKNLFLKTSVSSTQDPHTENCLAKLLLGMPWQSILPVEQPRFLSRTVPGSSLARRVITVAALPQPPARAPPFSLDYNTRLL